MEHEYKEGDRVELLANELEGWPQEFGTVDYAQVGNGMLIVMLDPEYITDQEGDDGIREVCIDDVRPA